MPIDFAPERWETIKQNYGAWWAGKLKRPLLNFTIGGRDPGRPEPDLPNYGFTSFYDLSVPAERIVDRWDYNLSRSDYVGDGFPALWPNFGAGVLAALLGARLENRSDTTWFFPPEDREIADLSFSYEPDNVWFRRIEDLKRAAVERWQGTVQVSMTDIGGALDVLSTFRPGEKLLLDLWDHPEEVKRATWQVHRLWRRYFEEFDAILQPTNPGYTAWTAIYSVTPYYMLQCDFCYMIGPEMFSEFVKPELEATCRWLSNPFYHLDGPGQLPHLDALLEIKELKGVQWIPGDGQATAEYWPEVYRKIRNAGKLIQLFDGQAEKPLTILDRLADQLGSAEGIIVIGDRPRSEEDEVMKLLERYDAL